MHDGPRERRPTAAAVGVGVNQKKTPNHLTTPNTSAVVVTIFAEPAAFDHQTAADRFLSVLRSHPRDFRLPPRPPRRTRYRAGV